MPLKLTILEVWEHRPDRELTPDTPPDHLVTITTGDQLRGELEAKRLKLPAMTEAPMNATALWLWAAMARLGITELRAAEFMANPPEMQPVKGADGGLEAPDVDPTQAGAGAPA